MYAVVTGVLDQQLDAQRAIELPRFLLERPSGDAKGNYVIQSEDGFSPNVLRDLGVMGHAGAIGCAHDKGEGCRY